MVASQDLSYGKMSPGRSHRMVEKISEAFLKASARSKKNGLQFLNLKSGTAQEPSWQKVSQLPGELSMLSFGECPREENVSFLSQILIPIVPPPILFESDGLSKYSQKVFRAWQKSTKGFGTGTDQSSELKVFENHTQDARYTGPLKVLPTCSATYGTGGNNQPFVVHNTGVDIKLPRQHKYHSGCYVTETETCRTIDTHVNGLSSEQGGTAVVSVPLSFGSSKADRFTKWDQEQIGSLAATDYKDGPMVYESEKSFVRRLTPTECARLQGFPDWWCSDLETENPTESDLAFWRKVFTDYAKVYGKKARTDNQIKKFLANPHTDSAEYKTWGNGVALPCVWFVLAGIKFYAESVHESVLNKYLESV